jgi:hypothetical protein
MTGFYVPREARTRETVGAVAVALGVAVSVGNLSFYLVRMLLAREHMESKAPPHVAREPERHRRTGSEGAK